MSCTPSNDFANKRDLFEKSKAESCKQKEGKNSPLFFNQVVWRTTASVTRPKYLARWPTFTFRLINNLSILCKTWFLLFSQLFLTNSHLELLQMPWVQERGSRRRRRRSARPRPRRKRSQRLEVGEERGGTAGSSRARSQLGREVVQAEHQPALQAAAGADALGRRWQRWGLANVATFYIFLHFYFFKFDLAAWSWSLVVAGPSGGRQPFSFVSQEVVEATCQCLLAQAEEGEKKGQNIEQIERIVLEEFGRCLVQIIDFAGKAKKS